MLALEMAATPSAYEKTARGAVRVARAILSVSDKRGIVELARGLDELGVEIVSTGGTAHAIEGAGIPVRAVSDLTGFPEIMDGRIKTLHPKVYAGVLAIRDDPEHLEAAAVHDVEWVDLICVNLYPFERTAAQRGVSEGEAIEDIDIGGPTMIRAAAKNFAFCAAVTSPESYDAVLDELRESDRRLSLSTRESLAAEAFAYTARYDAAIARWFQEKTDDPFPPVYVRAFEKVLDLSYGENPHQRAAYYGQIGARRHMLSQIVQHQGKGLSYNNLLDLNAARLLIEEFSEPACAIIKHNTPCGMAVADTIADAYRRAFAADPMSAYGGVIALNRNVDEETARALAQQFLEVLIAPGYDDAARELLATKESLRLLEDHERRRAGVEDHDLRRVIGGLLVQQRDAAVEERDQMRVVTRRAPEEAEWRDLLFAWRVCKHVRSNAIVLARDGVTTGIGAGQMSRVDSVRLAVEKGKGTGTEGAAMASDAFFPFPDGPEAGFAAGVTAIVQPGGSKRDDEVIEAADRVGAAMVFTARRHFRH